MRRTRTLYRIWPATGSSRDLFKAPRPPLRKLRKPSPPRPRGGEGAGEEVLRAAAPPRWARMSANRHAAVEQGPLRRHPRCCRRPHRRRRRLLVEARRLHRMARARRPRSHLRRRRAARAASSSRRCRSRSPTTSSPRASCSTTATCSRSPIATTTRSTRSSGIPARTSTFATLRPFLRLRPPENGPRPTDLEGIALADAHPGGALLLASEGRSRVLRVEPDGATSWITPALDEIVRPLKMLRINNAGLEGIARLPNGRILVAAERELRGLIELPAAGLRDKSSDRRGRLPGLGHARFDLHAAARTGKRLRRPRRVERPALRARAQLPTS